MPVNPNLDSYNEEAAEINLRSEDINEILSYIPHWVIRWGTTVLFIVIGLLVGASYVLKYPDIIHAPVTFSTASPPIQVVAPVTGRLAQLKVKHQQDIKGGQLVAVIDNPTNYGAVLKLKKVLRQLDNLEWWEMVNESLPKIKNLGILQSGYAQLNKNIRDYQNFLGVQAAGKRKASIQREIVELKKGNDRLMQQKPHLEEIIRLAEINSKRYDTLAGEVVSVKDAEQQEREVHEVRLRLENLRVQLQQNELRITQLENDRNNVGINAEESENAFKTNMEKALRDLQGQIPVWEEQYLIKAPISGTVSLPLSSQKESTVQTGGEIMTIVPKDTIDVIGYMALQGMGAGKVQKGQRVNIKLNDYPYHEFGMLFGKVHTIDLVPRNSSYEVTVLLENGFVTNYKDTIDFKQGMIGQGEVITEDLRLLERIFNQFKAIFKQTIETADE